MFLSLVASSAFALKLEERITSGGFDFYQDGYILHLRMVDQKMQLIFLNEDREVIQPPYTQGTMRLDYTRQKASNEGQIFMPLELMNNLYLQSARNIRLPHYFFAYITLTNSDDKKMYLPRARITPEITP